MGDDRHRNKPPGTPRRRSRCARRVDTIAAATAAVLVCGWLARAALWPVLDAVAPGAMFGLAGWHGGCVMRDACLGTPTGFPGVGRPRQAGVDRHPVELYAALLLTRRRPCHQSPEASSARYGAATSLR